MIPAGMFLRLALCAGLALGLAQCGLLRRKAPPRENRMVEDMRHGRRPMGQITWLNPGGTFVHVRSPLASVTEADAVLVAKTSDGTTTGKLKVSPERNKKNVMAADIAEGSPKIGDVVFFQTAEKAVSTAPPPEEIAAAGPAASAGGATAAGASEPAAFTVPAVEPAGPSMEAGGGMSADDLPPLGEPSGPREIIPNFPGLSELPEPGQENAAQ